MRPWIAYTLVRVGLFAVAFAILYVLGVPWWAAALLAAAIGFCVAYIFFRGLRERVADELVAARTSTAKRPDEAAEDDE